MAPFSASVRASAVPLLRAEGIGDTTASRTVYATVVLLALIGLAFVALAIWLFRSTRPDPELLAPLELMDDRRWRRLDPQDRRRSLDDARPADAAPLRRPQRPPVVDDDFGRSPPVRSLDDLATTQTTSGVDSDTDRDGVSDIDHEQIAADTGRDDVSDTTDGQVADDVDAGADRDHDVVVPDDVQDEGRPAEPDGRHRSA